MYKIEPDLPDGVKGNAQWIKDLYGEIESRPVTSAFSAQKKDKLLSDFNKEAESIYNLDAKNRELPTIKEYMREKYSVTTPQIGGIKTSNEPQKKDGSVTESLLNPKSIIGQNYGKHQNTLSSTSEAVSQIGYNKKPFTYALPSENEDGKSVVSTQMIDDYAYGKPAATYTNYSSKSGTIQNNTKSKKKFINAIISVLLSKTLPLSLSLFINHLFICQQFILNKHIKSSNQRIQ